MRLVIVCPMCFSQFPKLQLCGHTVSLLVYLRESDLLIISHLISPSELTRKNKSKNTNRYLIVLINVFLVFQYFFIRINTAIKWLQM